MIFAITLWLLVLHVDGNRQHQDGINPKDGGGGGEIIDDSSDDEDDCLDDPSPRTPWNWVGPKDCLVLVRGIPGTRSYPGSVDCIKYNITQKVESCKQCTLPDCNCYSTFYGFEEAAPTLCSPGGEGMDYYGKPTPDDDSCHPTYIKPYNDIYKLSYPFACKAGTFQQDAEKMAAMAAIKALYKKYEAERFPYISEMV